MDQGQDRQTFFVRMMVVTDKVSFYFFLASNDADWNQATNYDHVPDISRVNFGLRGRSVESIYKTTAYTAICKQCIAIYLFKLT